MEQSRGKAETVSSIVPEKDAEGKSKQEFVRTCNFYVKKKRRFCRMLVRPGLNYCGQHLVEEPDADKSYQRKRIPCPLDPKHSCFEDNLEHHIVKCNAREMTNLPYMKHNINQRADIKEEPIKTPLSALSDQELLAFIAKVEKAHQDHVGPIEESILHHSALDEEMKTPGYGQSVIRHLDQNSSLLGHLDQCGFLDTKSKSTCYVEFGAGRGQLTHWLTESVTDTRKALFVLVDRGSQRYKFDAKLKYREELSLCRIRVDIQHLDLNSIEGIESYNSIVGVGKHLCGGATDLTLYCLSKLRDPSVSGLALALCCHHRCTWSSYVGVVFLQECGFSPEEFYTLTSFTSWATCNSRDVGSKEEKQVAVEEENDLANADKEGNTEDKCAVENRYTRLGLSAEYREEVGRKAKQIIDYGRLKFLQGCGFKSRLVKYVTKEITLENIALIAEA
ncbi:tRNA:m(4)X modification enzyme TRM13 homolog isoform X2 [Penaeus japonicus]|uniref:tRNA:m(4)X modification enzyme TRM13 homolog isoform X2 n=1 Tax=Penaeus japonicus TaxID=27405 RepID=UPI001C713F0B|nr:tRNA:m(4)X modification enzyme TRM13 homolog isoform X2 [Penaeus japonicus]